MEVMGHGLKVQNLRRGSFSRRLTIVALEDGSLDDEWRVVTGTNIVLVGGDEVEERLRRFMLEPNAAARFPGGLGGGPEQSLRKYLGILRSRRGRPKLSGNAV